MPLHDEIEIEEFDYDPNYEVYQYPCPCGDHFEITLSQLKNGENIANCPTCSLFVKVIFNPQDFPGGDKDKANVTQPIEAQ